MEIIDYSHLQPFRAGTWADVVKQGAEGRRQTDLLTCFLGKLSCYNYYGIAHFFTFPF